MKNDTAEMNRFAAASLVNTTTEGQPSYKQALLSVLQQQQKPGSSSQDSEWISVLNNSEDDLRPDRAIDYTEMRSREYTEGPGEMDMLIGFFLMNGACIVFFLTFGLCVICSCMRKKPRFVSDENSEAISKPMKPQTTTTTTNSTFASKINKLRSKSIKKTPPPSVNSNAKGAFVAPPPITSPMLKPTFKAIVTRAMEQQKLAQAQLATGTLTTPNAKPSSRRGSKASTTAIEAEEQQKLIPKSESKGDRVCVQIEEPIPNDINHTTMEEKMEELRKNPKSPIGAVRQQTAHEEEEETTTSTETSDDEQPSVVRQNLLGPLSFDDLYFM